MERKRITPDPSAFPEVFHPLLKREIYDSSCSNAARVFYLPEERCFLKTAPKGSLQREKELTAFFHTVYKAPAVLAYLSDERDWLLTSAVEGEDCIHPDHLADPKRLCDLLGETLRTIHSLPVKGCPVEDHRERYFATAEENHRRGEWDLSYCHDAFATPETLKSREVVAQHYTDTAQNSAGQRRLGEHQTAQQAAEDRFAHINGNNESGAARSVIANEVGQTGVTAAVTADIVTQHGGCADGAVMVAQEVTHQGDDHDLQHHSSSLSPF